MKQADRRAMRMVKRRAVAKLRSRIGESIGETLVSLLISALALTMLAGAITAATRVITQSKTKMSEYYAGDSAMAAHSGGATISVTLTAGTDTVTLSAQSYQNSSSIGTVAYGPAPSSGD